MSLLERLTGISDSNAQYIHQHQERQHYQEEYGLDHSDNDCSPKVIGECVGLAVVGTALIAAPLVSAIAH